MALKFSNAAYSQSELSTGRKHKDKQAYVKEPQQETTFIMTQLDHQEEGKAPVVIT